MIWFHLVWRSCVISCASSKSKTTGTRKIPRLKQRSTSTSNGNTSTRGFTVPHILQWRYIGIIRFLNLFHLCVIERLYNKITLFVLSTEKFLLPMLKGEPAKPKTVSEHEARMIDCLDQIENIWLKDKPFLTGDKITVADLFGVCEIEQPSKYNMMFQLSVL